MVHSPTLDRHPSTYPSPTLSPTVSLPSLSGSCLLKDLDGLMPHTPSTSELQSPTGFEPLQASPTLHENSLQLTTSPGLDAEGQQGRKQGQGSTLGTTAATGVLHQRGEPEPGSVSTTDEADQESADPGYETAFMELRILRLSSRRLLNTIVTLSRSKELGRMPFNARLDDRIATGIFDVHLNLEATTSVMSRSYVVNGYESSRFQTGGGESVGPTGDHGSGPNVADRLDNNGTAPSESTSSQGEGTELRVSDTPTLDGDTSADTLVVSAQLKAGVEDVSNRLS
ncbi:hypothetical protein LXA43DRAFT_1024314 [Ganoderma leucocontextum]|nr:hypothetical protein LXA43DRAFT_1024314 [Ganoderma leucocontextum]